MRRLLMIFLLSVLPFQFTWGAAAVYCSHEQGAAASHFGHHSHQHRVKAASGETSSVAADLKLSPLADDPDCVFCHLGCMQPLCRVSFTVVVEPIGGIFVGDDIPENSSPPAAIERPRWSLAA